MFPKPPKKRGPGRPRADNRAIVNGIWYVLWTGCQWKAVHTDWFGVSSSVLHERFQTWQETGIFAKIMQGIIIGNVVWVVVGVLVVIVGAVAMYLIGRE